MVSPRERHRAVGPAIETTEGTKKWFLNGRIHRENGPATELFNGTKEWYQKGQLHRTDGPAIENIDKGIKLWYFDGRKLTVEETAIAERNAWLSLVKTFTSGTGKPVLSPPLARFKR